MNPILKAIAEAKFSIPPDVLNRAFAPANIFGRATAMNIDAMIRQQVIDARVRPDCDLVGGAQMDIPLRGIHPEQVPLPAGTPYSWGLVYRIPMALTQNRIITRPLFISNSIAPISGSYSYASYNGSALANAAMGVMQSQAPIPNSSTARVDLIEVNTILVSDTNQWPYDSTLRCIVENDRDMSTLPPGAYHHFAKLCGFAIRAYIYNTLVIQIGRGELESGNELGRIKEVIDGYSDANQMYLDFLGNEWRECAAYSDPITARDWMRFPFGAGV